MGEFNRCEKDHWRYDRVEHGKCKACGTPVKDVAEVYVACLSYREAKYSVLCVPCYEKRQARKLGDKTDDAVVNRGKNDYEIADIVKACRHLLMKMRVENDPMCKDIDEWEKGSEKDSMYLRAAPHLPIAIRAFPLALSRIAVKQFGRAGEYDKYRLELFIKLAMRLRTFLPRVTGQMLDRIYRRNRAAMAKKAKERGERHEWIKRRDSLPERLYPLTMDSEKFAAWLRRQLPPSVSSVSKVFGYWDNKTRDEVLGRLGVDGGSAEHGTKVHVTVYNTSKGPKFLVTYE